MRRAGRMLAVFGFFLFAQVAQADWTPAKRLTWSSVDNAFPKIAVDSSGGLHVVWHSSGPYAIYYKASADGGEIWTPTRRLTWNPGNSGWPAIAVDSSDNLHVVWNDDMPGNAEIYYKKSTDGGAAWTLQKRLTWTSDYSESAAIAVDSSDNLHVVWSDYTPGNCEIFYKSSSDVGVTWIPSKRLTWTSGSSWDPNIAVDTSGNLHVVWGDDTPGNYAVYYKKSTDGGGTWTPAKRLSLTSGNSAGPAIAVDSSDNLHVVWQDDTPGNYEIYYRKSTDGGTTWSPGMRLTWTSGESYSPCIAVDYFSNLHVVWVDSTPGIGQIYYKKYVK
jgi:hypothetical protein